MPHEGLRLGTVRRPPRGVPKAKFASLDYYDVWMPLLSPSPELVKLALNSRDAKSWKKFVRRYRSEMSKGEVPRILDLLAALSHNINFSVGCYCEDERYCHRSVLRELLRERDASMNN